MLRNRRELKTSEKFIVAFFVLVVTVIVGCFLFYFSARKPLLQAKAQATKVAQESVGLQEIDKYYIFSRKDTYYSVLGKDNKDHEVYVLVKDGDNKAIVLLKNQGITEDKAKDLVTETNRNLAKITAVELGMYKNKPVWEVVGKDCEDKFNYYLLDFKTGKKIKENTAI